PHLLSLNSPPSPTRRSSDLKLLSAISEGIRRIVRHDLAALALYDSETSQFRVQQLDPSYGKNILPGELLISLESSVAGQVFTSRDRKSTRLNSSHQIISYAV